MLVVAWLFCVACSYSFFHSYFFPKEVISNDSSLKEIKNTFDHDAMYIKFASIIAIQKELKNKSLNAEEKNILQSKLFDQKNDYNKIASKFSEEETWKWALPNYIN